MFNKGGLSDQLKNQPSMPELHQVLSQALESRGQRRHLSWRGSRGIKYTLTVICNLKGGDPQWILVNDKNKHDPLFDYTSCDVLLVSKILSNAVNESLMKSSLSFTKPDLNKQAQPSQPPAAKATEQQQPQQPHSSEAPPQSDTKEELPQDDSSFEAQQSEESAQNTDPSPLPNVGNLSYFPVTDLFEKINQEMITGKLEVNKDELITEVYFKNGLPVDAIANDTVGDDAVVELLTWNIGKFALHPSMVTNDQTITRPIEVLQEDSKKLTSTIHELKGLGMQPTSTLIATGENLPLNDQSYGPPISPEVLEKMHECLDGNHSVGDLAQEFEISRVKLIHWIHHLTRVLNAVQISNEAPQKSSLVLKPKSIDSQGIQQVMMSLRHSDTGMFIYPAFLYFLEQEYFRSYRTRSSFSVIVFKLESIQSKNGKSRTKPLPLDTMVEAVARISKLKRHVDLLSHYDNEYFALLLPNTKASGARTFGNKMLKALKDAPLLQLDPKNLSIAIGCASVPGDFKDLSSLLGAAEVSLVHAINTEQPMVLYRDIKNLITNQQL